MFVMQANITIGPYLPVKPAGMQWQHSVDDYADTASVTLPAISRLKRDGEVYEGINTASQLQEGMPVKLEAGYNGRLRTVFEGYVSRIKYGVPLVLECEGYSYLLRRKVYSASYARTTVRQLLTDLVQGTPISISRQTVDTVLPAVRFDKVPGIEVLEYLKRNLLTVYFNGNELYAGLRELQVPASNTYRLNWNTVGDDGLSFGPVQKNIVNVQVEQRKPNGSRQRSSSKKTGVKVKRVSLQYTQAEQDAIAAALTAKEEQKGFEGTLTTFLEPAATKGMSAKIIDGRYTERSGRYFIEAVAGSLDRSGGRQKLKLGRRLA